jgi:hypothetical protein
LYFGFLLIAEGLAIMRGIMRATSPEAIEQCFSVIPNGVAIARSFGSFGGGEQIVLQPIEAGSIPGVGPANRYFENYRTIRGTHDRLLRGTVCRFSELELEDENALAAYIPCAKENREVGYIIDSRDDTPTKLWLARAVLDAVNGNEALDPDELESIHVEHALSIATQASVRLRTIE